MATTDPTRFDSEFTVDDEFSTQYSRAYVRTSMLRLGYVRRMLPIYIVLVIIVFLSQLALRGVLWALAFGVPVGVVLAVLVYFASLLSALRSTRRRIERTVPEGSVYSLALDEKGFTVSDVVGSHRMGYQGCTAAAAGRHIVVLSHEDSGGTTYLPAKLFSAKSLAFFNERLEAANPPLAS